MKAPKRIEVVFSTGESWDVPIRRPFLLQKPAKPLKIRRRTYRTDDLVERLAFLLLNRCRSSA
jgi:hypothetical protein